jgi:hypothetical protein
MRWLIAFLIVSGLLSIDAPNARAQDLNPADVLSRLSSAPPEELSSLARQLALTLEVNGPKGIGMVEAPCDSFARSVRKPLSNDGGAEVDAIETHSLTCRRGFLILFVRQDGQWAHAGTILLEEHYGDSPQYRVTSSLVDGKLAVIVHHNLVDWGTGIQQKNMQVFLLMGTKVRLVFDEPESISIGVPLKNSAFVEKQSSSFRITPGTRSDPYATIEETRHSIVNGRSVTQYRNYTWDSRDQTFRAYSSGP